MNSGVERGGHAFHGLAGPAGTDGTLNSTVRRLFGKYADGGQMLSHNPRHNPDTKCDSRGIVATPVASPAQDKTTSPPTQLCGVSTCC